MSFGNRIVFSSQFVQPGQRVASDKERDKQFKQKQLSNWIPCGVGSGYSFYQAVQNWPVIHPAERVVLGAIIGGHQNNDSKMKKLYINGLFAT